MSFEKTAGPVVFTTSSSPILYNREEQQIPHTKLNKFEEDIPETVTTSEGPDNILVKHTTNSKTEKYKDIFTTSSPILIFNEFARFFEADRPKKYPGESKGKQNIRDKSYIET